MKIKDRKLTKKQQKDVDVYLKKSFGKLKQKDLLEKKKDKIKNGQSLSELAVELLGDDPEILKHVDMG